MLKHDFENSIGFWISASACLYHRALAARLAPEGITFRQCQVLGILALENQLSQHEFCDRLHLEPPTVAGILDRMERDGWIERSVDPADRRKRIVRAAAAARPVWSRILACAQQTRTEATAGLSSDELNQLRDLLERVQVNLRSPRRSREVG